MHVSPGVPGPAVRDHGCPFRTASVTTVEPARHGDGFPVAAGGEMRNPSEDELTKQGNPEEVCTGISHYTDKKSLKEISSTLQNRPFRATGLVVC